MNIFEDAVFVRFGLAVKRHQPGVVAVLGWVVGNQVCG
jgi:hypothetical protein